MCVGVFGGSCFTDRVVVSVCILGLEDALVCFCGSISDLPPIKPLTTTLPPHTPPSSPTLTLLSRWFGEDAKGKKKGVFPANFVKVLGKSDYVPPPPKKEDRPAPGAAAGAPPKKARAPPVDLKKLRYTLYAHNLGYASGIFAIIFGGFSMFWWANGGGDITANQQKRDHLWTQSWLGVYGIAVGMCICVYQYKRGLFRNRAPNRYVRMV